MTRTRMTTRIPARLQTALATRAEANHRSANAELCSIIEAAISSTPARPVDDEKEKLTHALADARKQIKIERRLCEENVAQREAYKAQMITAGARVMEREYVIQRLRKAMQQLIDDSRSLREDYEDMDSAVAYAQSLLVDVPITRS